MSEQNNSNSTSAELIASNVIDIRKAVFGGGTSGGGGSKSSGSTSGGGEGSSIKASDIVGPTAQGIASQAVAQSMAILVQDSVDLFRNIGTIESTAIGAATAKWLAAPENVLYKQIIDSSTEVLEKVTTLLSTVGDTAAKISDGFPKGKVDGKSG
jgi:hypothetical protein